MRLEHIDRRVLGAARFVDAPTGLPVRHPLAVQAEGVRLVRNLSGYFVIAPAPGLPAQMDALVPRPAASGAATDPGTLPVELTVRDPRGRYLARRHTVQLQLDPDPQGVAEEGALLRPVDVPLFLAPAAQTSPGWAVIRASLTEQGTERPLAGALIRVVRTSDSAHLASGLSDARGEALVAVPGIPVTTWEEGAGPVLASEVEVTLETVFDPAAGGIPDPTDLEARRASLPFSSVTVRLASGRVLVTGLSVDLP